MTCPRKLDGSTHTRHRSKRAPVSTCGRHADAIITHIAKLGRNETDQGAQDLTARTYSRLSLKNSVCFVTPPQAIQKGRKYVFGLFVLPTYPAARLPTLSCEFFVNPLTRLGASITFIAFAKQQLQGMHALIDAKQIPVAKNEDFFRQAADLEHALGDQTYARSVRRYGSARKNLVVIACAILAIAVLIFGLSMFSPASHVFKDITDRLMSDFTLFALVISVAAGVLLIGIIVARFHVLSLEKKLLGKDLSALWDKVLQRWAPELATKHDVINIEPSAIAQLVAVHTRIQDVNLDLN